MAPQIIKTPLPVPPWLQGLGEPTAQRLLTWGQAQADACLADVFGYHAVQAGWPGFDALRSNRMPHRWHAQQEFDQMAQPHDVSFDSRAWPWEAESLDLVVLPHTLEFSHDPHASLREVERVLVPEGRVVISGFNPWSLWGLSQQRAKLYKRVGWENPFLPDQLDFIAHWRMRDWLRLLSFEVDTAHFGCFRPSVQSPQWLTRTAWMDKAGPRWWRIFGAVYFLVGIKRVRGMRLMGPVWKRAKAPASNAVPTVNKVNKTQQEPHS